MAFFTENENKALEKIANDEHTLKFVHTFALFTFINVLIIFANAFDSIIDELFSNDIYIILGGIIELSIFAFAFLEPIWVLAKLKKDKKSKKEDKDKEK